MKRKRGKRIDRLTLTDFEQRFEIDERNNLYWDGEPIVTEETVKLTGRQQIGAIIIIVFTVLGALGGMVQGFAAYDTLACQLKWSASFCPSDSPPLPPPPAAVKPGAHESGKPT